MTGKTIVKRLESGAFSLDMPMAALAALSVAFVAYAMPDSLFTGVVEASGLSSLVPAARPPLGMTARLAVVAAGAAAAFLCTWLLLRALGNGQASARRRDSEDVEAPPLRLRRADFHPDAPLRRPLVAGLDLGEPEFIDEAGEDDCDPPLPACSDVEPTGENEEEWDERLAETDADDEIVGAPAPPPLELEEPSIAHLMQRLELGLIRRQRNPVAFAPESSGPAVEAPSGIDDRLRGAIDDLQKMAARGA